MNLTAMHAIFESLDDFGDVGDFENPELDLAKSVLEDFNKRAGTHFDISLFTEDPDEMEERRLMGATYHCPLYTFIPELKVIFPGAEIFLRLERHDPYPMEIDLQLRAWGSHVLSDLAVYRSGFFEMAQDQTLRLIKYLGKDVDL